jgi:hypothetical protein
VLIHDEHEGSELRSIDEGRDDERVVVDQAGRGHCDVHLPGRQRLRVVAAELIERAH